MAETGIINPAIEAVTINKCFLHTACVYIQPYMQAVFCRKIYKIPCNLLLLRVPWNTGCQQGHCQKTLRGR